MNNIIDELKNVMIENKYYTNEINTLNTVINNLKETICRMHTENRRMKDNDNIIQTEHDIVVSRLNNDIVQLRNEINTLNTVINNFKVNESIHKGSADEIIRIENKRMKEIILTLKNNNNTIQKEHDIVKNELDKLKIDYIVLTKKSIGSKKNNDSGELIMKHNVEISRLNTDIVRLQNKNNTLTNENQEYTNVIDTLSSEFKKDADIIAKLNNKINNLDNKIYVLEKTIDKLNNIILMEVPYYEYIKDHIFDDVLNNVTFKGQYREDIDWISNNNNNFNVNRFKKILDLCSIVELQEYCENNKINNSDDKITIINNIVKYHKNTRITVNSIIYDILNKCSSDNLDYYLRKFIIGKHGNISNEIKKNMRDRKIKMIIKYCNIIE